MSLKFDRDKLIKDLKEGVTEIHFNKVNGDFRVMKCTLDPALMPPQMKKEDLTAAEQDTNLTPDKINVWDIEAKGWRSFLLSKLVYVQQHPTF